MDYERQQGQGRRNEQRGWLFGETAGRRERALRSKTEGGHREGDAGNKRGESQGLQESRVTGQRRQLPVSEVRKWGQSGKLHIGTRVGRKPPRDGLPRKRSPRLLLSPPGASADSHLQPSKQEEPGFFSPPSCPAKKATIDQRVPIRPRPHTAGHCRGESQVKSCPSEYPWLKMPAGTLNLGNRRKPLGKLPSWWWGMRTEPPLYSKRTSNSK